MKKIGRYILSGFDRLSIGLGYVAMWAIVALMFITVFEVFMRYAFNKPTLWTAEISAYVLCGIAFFAAGHTMLGEKHVRVEILTANFSEKKRMTCFAITGIIALGCLIAMDWQSVELVLHAYRTGLKSYSALAVSYWIPYLVAPIGLTVLCMALISRIVHYISEIKQQTAKEKQ